MNAVKGECIIRINHKGNVIVEMLIEDEQNQLENVLLVNFIRMKMLRKIPKNKQNASIYMTYTKNEKAIRNVYVINSFSMIDDFKEYSYSAIFHDVCKNRDEDVPYTKKRIEEWESFFEDSFWNYQGSWETYYVGEPIEFEHLIGTAL